MKNFLHKVFNSLIALFIASSGFTLLATPVGATTQPTSVTINNAKAFQNIYNTGDILFFVYDTVDFGGAPDPNEMANFSFNLLGTDGTTLTQMRALSRYNTIINGTNAYNLISIYYSPTDALTLTWGSQYYVQITASPFVYGTITEGVHKKTVQLAPSSWITGSTASSRELLKERVLLNAEAIETATGTDMITTINSNQVLNDTGRTLVTNAVPYLDTPIPSLFALAMSDVGINQPTATGALQTDWTISQKLGAAISNAFDGIGTYLNMSGQMVSGLYWGLILCTVCSIIFVNSGNSTAAIVLSIPFTIIGVYSGFIPIALVFTVVFLIVILTGYYIFLRGM